MTERLSSGSTIASKEAADIPNNKLQTTEEEEENNLTAAVRLAGENKFNLFKRDASPFLYLQIYVKKTN